MTAEPAGDGSSGPGPRPAPGGAVFSTWLTVLCAAILLGLALLLPWPPSGLETLERPEASLERVVAREMDFRAAARAAPRWERRLYALAFASDADARVDAIGWYDELVELGGSPRAELHRLVLLAEDGRDEAVAAALEEWSPGGGEAARLEGWAHAAYGDDPPAPPALRAALAEVRRGLPGGWFADRLAARLAARLGDPAAAARAEAATAARGRTLLWRHRALLAVELLLLVLALGALVAIAWRRGGGPRIAAAPLPAPWSGRDGLGLFARGGAGLLGVALLGALGPEAPWRLAAVSLASAVPLALAVGACCRGYGISAGATFGLGVGRPALAALGGITAALVGLSTLADLAVETGGARLGLAPHWTDGFQERLVWGTRGDVLVDLLDSVIVAPVVEEVLFRGVLYGTLRRGLSPAPAALASAALFAGAHGYGAVGFGAVLASGVLWALAYERTRSLLPGILAHAAGNLFATGIVLATLRW